MNSALCPPADAAADLWRAHEVRIRSITGETADTHSYELEFVNPRIAAEYSFRPGQFNMLYLPGAGEAAISVSGRAQPGRPLIHTVRTVGNVTGALARLKAGETFGLRGPFGSSWPLEQLHQRDVIVVTGGIGLAPLRPVVYHLLDHRDQFGQATLLYGARTPDAMLYPAEYQAWRAGGVGVELTVDRADASWAGHVGVVTLLLERTEIRDPANTHVLVCGPEVMMQFVALGALSRQIPAENIWVSLERNMNCAVGLCGHCQLGPEFICKDGPVLPYPRVAHLLDVKGL